MSYKVGDTVQWNWGKGITKGVIQKKYHQKITIKIKDNEVTRDADEDNPAYRIEQSGGDEVLKSESELAKA